MKPKSFVVVVLVLLLISVSVLALKIQPVMRARAQSLPHLFVYPPSTTISGLGESVAIEVKVANVTNCYGVDFWLNYNSTLLSQVGGVDIHGPFSSGNPPIRPDPTTHPGGYVLTDLSVAGTVKVSLTFVGAVGAPSFNGTGTVCAITLQAEALGISNLTFDETKVKIWNPVGSAQPRDPSVNGEIMIIAPSPPPPVGGKATPINIPMNKPELQAPWIWLTTIILSLAVTVVYVKKRKRHTEINS